MISSRRELQVPSILRPYPRRTVVGRRARVTSIDIDGRKLRVAQAERRGGKTRVVGLAAEPLPEGPSALDLEQPEVVGRWLASVLEKRGIKPGKVVLGIPRRDVVLKNLELPFTDDWDELAQMVQFQSGKDLPFPLEDAVIDFTVDESDPTTDSARADDGVVVPLRVTVVAVRKNVVERYRAEAQAAGLKLHALGLRSYASVQVIQLRRSVDFADIVALVNLRQDEVIIDIVSGRTVAFSRAAGVSFERRAAGPGAETRTSAGGLAPLEEIVQEVARTVRSFESIQNRWSVERVWIGGDTGSEEKLAHEVGKRLGVPCTLLDPAPELGLEGEEADLAPASLPAIGLAMGLLEPRGLPFDFLHPKRVRKTMSAARRRKWTTSLAVVALLILGFVVREGLLSGRRRERDSLRLQAEAAYADSPRLNRQIKYSQVVDRWLAEDGRWLWHWSYLSCLLPPCDEVYVSRFSSAAGGSLEIPLHAKTSEVLFRLEQSLTNAGYEVEPVAVTPGVDRYGYGFRSTIRAQVTASMEIDLESMEVPGRPTDDGSLDAGPKLRLRAPTDQRRSASPTQPDNPPRVEAER